MKATEIIDHLINYIEADFTEDHDEDGGHLTTQYNFEAAKKATRKEFPNLGVATIDLIFEIIERYVSVKWERWKEEHGICYQPEFNIDKKADKEIDSLIQFKRRL